MEGLPRISCPTTCTTTSASGPSARAFTSICAEQGFWDIDLTIGCGSLDLTPKTSHDCKSCCPSKRTLLLDFRSMIRMLGSLVTKQAGESFVFPRLLRSDGSWISRHQYAAHSLFDDLKDTAFVYAKIGREDVLHFLICFRAVS